jgi:hypothetical protein
MEDINVLTIPKWVHICLFHFQYPSHGAHKICEKILFSNVVHQMEEYKSLPLSTYFKTYIRKHVNRLEPNFIYIYVHI